MAALRKYNLVVVGKTGSGKSTLCNKLVGASPGGPPFTVYTGMEDQTTGFQCVEGRLDNGWRVNVLDTPDVYNMGYPSDKAARKKFSEWEKNVSEDVPTAFLLTVRVDKRFTPNDEELCKKYFKLLPDGCENNIILVLTHTESICIEDMSHLPFLNELRQKFSNRFLVSSKTDSTGQWHQEEKEKLYRLLKDVKLLPAMPSSVQLQSSGAQSSQTTARSVDLSSKLASRTAYQKASVADSHSFQRSHSHPKPNDPQLALEQFRVVVIGETRAGKSTLCNKLLNPSRPFPEVFPVYTGMDGQTTKFQYEERQFGPSLICIVDTPDVLSMGYDDDNKLALKFREWEHCGPAGVPTAILLAMRVDQLIQEDRVQKYQQYIDLLPEKYRGKVIMAFTRSDAIPQEQLDEQIWQSAAASLLEELGGNYVAFQRHPGTCGGKHGDGQ